MPVMQPEAVELALRSAIRESDTSLDFVFVCVCNLKSDQAAARVAPATFRLESSSSPEIE